MALSKKAARRALCYALSVVMAFGMGLPLAQGAVFAEDAAEVAAEPAAAIPDGAEAAPEPVDGELAEAPIEGELAPAADEVEPFCEVRPIAAPVAGRFPASLYRNPYRANSTRNNGFDQTIVWSPAMAKTFEVDTEYTVTLRLTPNNQWNSVIGGGRPANFGQNEVTIEQIAGLPTERVKSRSYEYQGADMLITIEFEATGQEEARPQVIFYDDFTGNVNPYDRNNGLTTEFVRGPVGNRQGMSRWEDDMSWVDEDNGLLVLSFRRASNLAPNNASQYVRENFIRSSCARTRSKNNTDIHFENAFGYYEARIKFPKVNAMWGAFWLMYTAPNSENNSGVDCTELDIVETSTSPFNNGHNSAFHWDGYGNQHKEVYMECDQSKTGVNIYDGEFHTFGVEWSPTNYIFYVDDVYVSSYADEDSHHFDFENPENNWDSLVKSGQGIAQNPNYIKLSIEAADWSGMGVDHETPLGLTADYGEMLVDYVYVLNGPKPNAVTAGISAPALLDVDLGDELSYEISVSNAADTNLIDIEAQFDVSKLSFVDSEIKLPGWVFLDEPSLDETTGAYKATIWAGSPGKAISIGAAEAVLALNFEPLPGASYGDKFDASLVSVQVAELQKDSGAFVAADAILDPPSVRTTALDYTRFDLTGDGEIGMDDIATLLYYYFLVREADCDYWYVELKETVPGGEATFPPARHFDFNDDGVIDAEDIMFALTFIGG